MDLEIFKNMSLPQHVAIIMDGNGRWAKQRGLDRSEGHFEGLNAVRRITEMASDLGIKYLTLYAFSTENWNRPQSEVDALMHLMVMGMERETPDMIKNNVRMHIIGDTSRIPPTALERFNRCLERTSPCTGLNVILALSYSSRWEITQAARRIAADVVAGKLDINAISEDTISQNLTTANFPDPDLLIRTGGDLRVSNFLLWQIAYSEIFVTPTYWPDFDKKAFGEALMAYASRERRFGLTSEQVASSTQHHNSDND